MKTLPLTNPSFRYLEAGFKEWLDILGYAPSSVYTLPILVRELLHFLEQEKLTSIQQLTTTHIKAHYERLKVRRHQRRGGALSGAHLNKHAHAIRKFVDYLQQVGRVELPAVYLAPEAVEQRLTCLTAEEVRALYRVTETPYPTPANALAERFEVLRYRDKALLAIFYGCGLRRNEGVQLNVSDINFDRGQLHVRKGKNHTERIVPISKQCLHHLQQYVYDFRPVFRHRNTEALFLGFYGKRLGGQSLLLRLHYLQHHSQQLVLQEKTIGLHTLRHSIATHLLQGGMPLENISRFLGHRSLESTQIYTHLLPSESGEQAHVSAEASAKADITGTATEKQPYHLLRKHIPIQLHEDEL